MITNHHTERTIKFWDSPPMLKSHEINGDEFSVVGPGRRSLRLKILDSEDEEIFVCTTGNHDEGGHELGIRYDVIEWGDTERAIRRSWYAVTSYALGHRFESRSHVVAIYDSGELQRHPLKQLKTPIEVPPWFY